MPIAGPSVPSRKPSLRERLKEVLRRRRIDRVKGSLESFSTISPAANTESSSSRRRWVRAATIAVLVSSVGAIVRRQRNSRQRVTA